MISSPQTDRAHGFTLIELLVVMGIIALLAGIAIPTIMSVRTAAKKSATGSTLQQMRLAMETYSGDFGDYPPSTLRDCGVKTNKLNDGIESLVACFLTEKQNGPYFDFSSDRLINTDNDRVANFNKSTNRSGKAYEFSDEWGRPFIYFHNRDYERPQVANRYILDAASKRRISAKPQKDEKTDNWHGLFSYQIWSVGPNGRNENGGGDDIPSWKVE